MMDPSGIVLLFTLSVTFHTATGVTLSDISCTSPGKTIPDPLKCAGYWICDKDNTPHYAFCALGNYYDIGTKQCVPTGQTSCSPGADDAFECQSEGETFVDPSDCSAYVQCDAGLNATYNKCEGGLLFNVNTGACDLAANVRCGQEGVTQCVEPMDVERDDDDCGAAWICDDKYRPYHFHCDAGTQYNHDINVCEPPNEVYCPSSAYQCPPEGGAFQDPTDCSSFLWCSGGPVQRAHCNQGSLFNGTTCTSPDGVQCAPGATECYAPGASFPDTRDASAAWLCDNGFYLRHFQVLANQSDKARNKASAKVAAPCTTPGQIFPDESDCAAFWICDAELNLQYTTCNPGYRFNATTGTCELLPPDATCSKVRCAFPSQKLVDVTDCTQFWLCDEFSQPHLFTCDDGLLFDGTACTAAASVSCASNQVVQCSYTGEIIQDDDDCASRWVCTDKLKPYYYTCDSGYYYNFDLHRCDLQQNVYCPSAQPQECLAANETYVNPFDCVTYFLCVCDDGGQCNVQLKNCPSHQWYDDTTHSCNYPELGKCPTGAISCHVSGATDADHAECTKAWFCDDTFHLQHVQCHSGLLFNDQSHGCEYPENVQCEPGSRECSTPGDFVQNVQDCSKFWQCNIDYKLDSYQCQTGLYFNSVTDECDFPENVECTHVQPRPYH